MQKPRKLEKEQFYTFHSKVRFVDKPHGPAGMFAHCLLSSKHTVYGPSTHQSCVMQEFIDFISNSEEDYSEYIYQDLPDEHSGLKFGIDNDCPVFPGLWDFCRLYAGASVGTLPSLSLH